jgi:dTDP-4-dehydrorhamnose reductase
VRVLIIGLDTPVGRSLEQLFIQRERDYVGLNRSDCRWKSERQAKKAVRRSKCDIALDLRIQAASDGGVKVHELDVQRTAWLASAAQGAKMPFLHVSCSRVFKGVTSKPYGEEDIPDGESSIAGLLIAAENEVRKHCERHLILRMGPIFSPWGINVMTHLLRQLNEGEVLYLDREHRSCPVPSEDGAWVLNAMLDQISCGLESWGNYHYCSADGANYYEMGEVLLAAASQYLDLDDDRIQPNPERPPRDRELACDRIRNTFAIKRQPWRASVAGYVKQYFDQWEAPERVESDRQ